MGSAAAAVGGGIFQGVMANQSRVAANKGFKNQGGYLQGQEQQALGYYDVLNPYQQAGQSALNPLTGLLSGKQYDESGKETSLTPEQRDELLYQSPGYRFAVQQGQQGLERNQIAHHNSLGGGAQKELAGYLSGTASQYSNNYINQLASLAGIGQNAANTMATGKSAVTQNFGTQIGETMANRGLVNANYYTQLGNIGANTVNSIGGGQSSGGGSGGSGGFGGGNSGFTPTGGGGQFNSAATNQAGMANLAQFAMLA